MEPIEGGEQKEGYIQYPPVRTQTGPVVANSDKKNASGFYDELSLAACWLYKATGDEESFYIYHFEHD